MSGLFFDLFRGRTDSARAHPLCVAPPWSTASCFLDVSYGCACGGAGPRQAGCWPRSGNSPRRPGARLWLVIIGPIDSTHPAFTHPSRGAGQSWGTPTGGVASLDPRLISVTPTGVGLFPPPRRPQTPSRPPGPPCPPYPPAGGPTTTNRPPGPRTTSTNNPPRRGRASNMNAHTVP